MDVSKLKIRIQNKKPANIHSEFQFKVNEVWEMLDKKVAFPLLAGLFKRKPKEFNRAKDYIYGMIKDGVGPQNKVSYFLWLIKHYAEIK